MIPRIRGRVGQDEYGNWVFETSLWTFDGETRIGEPFTFGPWRDEKEAHAEMNKCVQIMSETVEKMNGEEPTGKYIDMKNGGVLTPWMKQ